MDNINDIVNRYHQANSVINAYQDEWGTIINKLYDQNGNINRLMFDLMLEDGNTGMPEELLEAIAEEAYWYEYLETKYTDFIITGLESQFQ